MLPMLVSAEWQSPTKTTGDFNPRHLLVVFGLTGLANGRAPRSVWAIRLGGLIVRTRGAKSTPSNEKPASRPVPWAALVHRDFFFLWTSGVFLNVSMVVRTLVAAQWLFDTTGSKALLGFLGAVQLLQLPMALYGGTLADRFDRKKLMVFTQVVAVVMLGLLTYLAATHTLKPWHIFAITAVSGMVNTMGGAARPAMLPRVVPRALLPQAVTFLTMSGQIAQIGAPLVFWGLYDKFGAANSFGVAMLITFASVVFPFMIKASGKPDSKPRANTWTSLKEGLAFVARHPLLPGLYGVDLGVTIVSFYRQLFPIFARDLYNLGARGTGLLNAANSIGSIIGTLLVFFTDRIPRKGVLVIGCTLVYAIFLIFFGLNRVFWVGLLIVGVLGATDSVSMTMRQAIVQLTTPDELLGRASSVRNFAAMGSNNLGQIEVGVMSAAIGAGNTMIMGGILGICFVGLVWKLFPGLRTYEFRPGQAVESATARPS